MSATTTYYWCLTHQRPEAAEERDDVDHALGPYPTEEAARNWRELNETRAAAWKEEDDAWFGTDEDGDEDQQ
ncbi:hypothetical protein BH20ACT3_BH20ACT3_12930 [soil metagenome]